MVDRGKTMRIGVLGTGQVARAIAGHWVRAGHEVVFGSRSGAPEDPAQFEPASRFGTMADAAGHGDVILLAVPWSAMEQVVTGPIGAALAGKILLDASNSLSPVNHHGDLPDLSGAELIARWVPGAALVKIFNTAGVETLEKPDYPGGRATMFFATDSDAARVITQQLAAECGFDPVHAGPLAVARDLEALTRFWGKLAFSQKLGRRIAFHLLQENP